MLSSHVCASLRVEFALFNHRYALRFFILDFLHRASVLTSFWSSWAFEYEVMFEVLLKPEFALSIYFRFTFYLREFLTSTMCSWEWKKEVMRLESNREPCQFNLEISYPLTDGQMVCYNKISGFLDPLPLRRVTFFLSRSFLWPYPRFKTLIYKNKSIIEKGKFPQNIRTAVSEFCKIPFRRYWPDYLLKFFG